jgi:hypothetical protein
LLSESNLLVIVFLSQIVEHLFHHI